MPTLPQPLQVDATDSVWDIIVALATCVAAIGAVGALIFGAFTYYRQVRDARAIQASKVTVYLKGETIYVDNLGDLPIYSVQIAIGGTRPYTPIFDRLRLASGESMSAEVPEALRASGLSKGSTFTDSNGIRWSRFADGRLTYLKQTVNSRPKPD